MSTLTRLSPQDLEKKLRTENIRLIDIRETDEFAREHIKGAVSMPLSSIAKANVVNDSDGSVAFMCRSGMRTDSNCAKLSSLVAGDAFVLEGGLEGWKKQGLGVARDDKAPLELNRQVQIAAGGLVLVGVGLSILVHPGFVGIAGFVGAGLVFAGSSGWCGMAHVLRIMPWNRSPSSLGA